MYFEYPIYNVLFLHTICRNGKICIVSNVIKVSFFSLSSVCVYEGRKGPIGPVFKNAKMKPTGKNSESKKPKKNKQQKKRHETKMA